MKKQIILIFIIAVVLILGVWYGASKGPEQKEAIKIGVILPLTGGASSYGLSWKRGVELGIEKVQREYDVEIEVIFEDSQMQPVKSATLAQKLIAVDKVGAIIIGSSRETLAACPVAETNKVLLLSAGTSPGISKAGDYIFRIYPSDSYQGSDLADLATRQGYKSVAILTVADDYGKGIADFFEEKFEKQGGEVTIMETFMPEGFSDFKSSLRKIALTEPDVLLLLAYSHHFPLILKQIKELDLKIPLFASETLYDVKVLESVGDLAEGILLTSYTEPKTKEYDEFVFLHQGKYNENPGPFSAGLYDNTVLVLKALIENERDLEKAKNWLYSIKDFSGATGITNYDSNGDVIGKSYSIFEVQDGKFIPYQH